MKSLHIALAALASFLFSLAAIARPTDPPRPNVLLIVADDQGTADFSHLGIMDDVRTPRLDALAASGTRFTQAYATSPICNPSRVGLITGRYQQRWNNFYYGGGRGLPDEAVTLAERLRDAGYATGYFGKVHTGGPDRTPDAPGFPLNHGFDRFFGTTTGGRTHYLYHSNKAVQRYGEAAGQMFVAPMWDDDEPIEWEGFTTVAFTDEAIEFIEGTGDRPFFVQLAYNAVHNFAWQLPQDELEARGLEPFPDWDPDEIGYREWYKGVHRRDWPEGRAYYLAQLEILDREIGRLLDVLETRGELDNTLVIYTVDNGGCVPDWADNTPLAGSKYHLLEGGIRVPLIFAMPEVLPVGIAVDSPVSALDIVPTVLELCDVSHQGTHGKQFDGWTIIGPTEPPPPNLMEELGLEPFTTPFQQSLGHNFNPPLFWDIGWQWAVRHGDWKLMVTTNENVAKNQADFEQVKVRMGVHLYNLADDPGETTNLAERHPEEVAELRALHRAWRAEVGQPIE